MTTSPDEYPDSLVDYIMGRAAPVICPPISKLGLCYLATPYSKYPAGIEQAFRDAAALTGRLLIEGAKVYSPIAHTHPVAIHGNIDPLNHDIWLPFDAAMMDVAQTLLVAQMDTWEISYGVKHEIDVFRAAGKPIYYLDPSDLSVSWEPTR